jgi:hypothetical protein
MSGGLVRRLGAPGVVLAVLAAFLLVALAAPAASPAADAQAAKKKNKKDKKYKGPKIPTPDASRCDFLDTSVCLHPFPNDMYLADDAATVTGKRVNLNPESMLKNAAGTPIDPTDANRNDGFSPGQAVVIRIDGLDTQEAFDRSGIVPIDDPRAYRERKQPVMVINARTKKRHPVFAEIDAAAASDDDRTLIIRPLENWEEGQRYIVVLRQMRTADGKKIKAPNAFKVYAKRLITKQKEIEERREYFEKKIFKTLRKTDRTGRRKKMYMAWDFSVASGESLSERVLAMRDDAFAKLGDTNLADRAIQGDSPDFTIDDTTDNPDAETLRRIEGTLDDVPCYLNQDGCPPGSQFMYDSDGSTMPTWNPGYTVDVPFECNIPNSIIGAGKVKPARPTQYGHGLLGSRRQAHSSYVRDFGNNYNLMHCAVNWDGFSEDDVLPVVLPALTDVTVLSQAFDRMQQGFVNFMMLGRAMIHPDGFASDAAFQYDAGSGMESVIDDTELYYYGNSQGGIMGGALTAISPDVEQSVLGVPGMNYSTLLRRSVDFDDYALLPGVGLYANYPNELERPLLLGLMQMLWDRGEANGYAHHMTDDPYPNTPTHNVLMHPALGDHQVATLTAENMARTIDGNVLEPALDPGRHWQSDPLFGMPEVPGFPWTKSTLVYFDGGPVGFTGTEGMGTATPPNENVPPREENGFGEDPHSYPRKSPVGQQQMSDWLRPQGALLGGCGGPCYANGWTGP